jgi:TonB family protein
VAVVALLSLMQTVSAQSGSRLDDRLLILFTKKIAAKAEKLDIKLQSGDHITVPAEDVNNHATETVRAALRSQSSSLPLPPPERVVVVNVATLPNADDHGRVLVTLVSGATFHCRADDIRPDPRLTFLRTILAEEISKQAALRAAPPGGAPGSFGPSFQFDTKGADFGEWQRSFVAQLRHNWMVPYAVANLHGHVVMSFTVHRDGAITDITVVQPSEVELFTKSAVNALEGSNPTVPLPQEYPDEKMVISVTFYFNEKPAIEWR